MAVSNAGARPNVSGFQANHTIPEELFTASSPPDLIRLLRDTQNAISKVVDLDSPANLQPLPTDADPLSSAAHRGSHPGYTEAVSESLRLAAIEFNQVHAADIQAVESGTADRATIERLRDNVAAELRRQIDDIQFRSTNFMDTAASAGNRLVYNRRDIAYLQLTAAWAQASPADQAAALRGAQKPNSTVTATERAALKDKILKHNESVLRSGLSQKPRSPSSGVALNTP